MSNRSHVLVAGRGYWGVGQSFDEAVRNAKWLRKGDKVFTAPCPEKTRVDEMGRIYTPAGTRVEDDFTHGIISGTAKELKFKANAVQPQ